VAKTKLEALEARRLEASERARRRLGLAAPAILPFHPQWLEEVTPAFNWRFRHLEHIAASLAAFANGDCRRLILNVPPRHGKSEMVTVRFVAWLLERDPAANVIVGAYSQFLANKFSRKIRRIVRGRIPLDPERKAVEEWQTLAGGGVRAAGVGAGITGVGADFLIIDDPVKSREEAESEARRERCGEWFNDDAYTRLHPGGGALIIQTRWHEDDLTGRLLAEMEAGGETWTLLNLPALAEAGDPLGRAPGEALCPERYDETALARIRAKLGQYSFSALYQGAPVSRSGGLFKRDWFRIEDRAPDGLQWFCYADLAQSLKEGASNSAWGDVALGPDGTLWIRDMEARQAEWPDIRRLLEMRMRRRPEVIYGIEQALHGLTAVQEWLRDPAMAAVSFRPIPVNRDKVVRAQTWTWRAETGKVILVRGDDPRWIRPFLDEVASFPKGRKSDQVDVVSGGVEMVAGYGGQVTTGIDIYGEV
jgi:hypothetical protein